MAAAICTCAAAIAQTPGSPTAPYTRSATQNGTDITLTITPVDAAASAGPTLQELENVLVRVKLTDKVTGSPLPGALPAAWIDNHHGTELISQPQCVGEVKRFAEGSTFSHAQLDLTSFYVVIMNTDATLTVVDPRFGYGDTRLLAMVPLDGPAGDWAVTENAERIFVSVPASEKLLAVDTASWKIVAAASGIPKASRVVLQPDEAYVWVSYAGEGADSGVVAIDAHTLKTVARIRTGSGYHHIAFSDDSSLAFVSNRDDGTVSVVDVRKLAKVSDVTAGAKPGWIAYSALANAAYVADEGDGTIVVIDGTTHQVRAKMTATPGLGQIRFAPGGRFALAVNPQDDEVYVVDSASDRIVQKGTLDKSPDEISFTNKQAHIRHRGTDAVLMIALESLGRADAELSVADFSGGRHSPGEMTLSSPADSIVQASGENAVLVANPGDRSVYFYMEGAAAPMGNFSDYGHEPRAVLSIDRNLRERAPGVYETNATLPAEGAYDLALFLDRPRIVSCFDLPIAPDPRLASLKKPKLHVEPRVAPTAGVNQSVHVAFRLTEVTSGKPLPDAQDVVVLMMGPAWQHRDVARYRGDGVYSVDFSVPTPGMYSVLLSSSSLGVNYAPYATLQVQGASK